MIKQLRPLLLTLLAVASGLGLNGQSVWPGDVNNNGIVNGVDFLFWGEAFGSGGAPRDDESTDWEAQVPPSGWAQSFPNGLNYYFADCDGNGFVDDEEDDDAIEDNFGLTHGTLTPDSYQNATPGTAPALQLVPATNIVGLGQNIDIALLLGTEELPVDAFKGMALQLSITTAGGSLIDDLEFELTEDNWLDPSGNFVRDYFIEDGEDSELAITRINQQAVSGSGEIGRFSVVIEDIIVGLNVDTVKVNIDSVYFVGEDFITLPIEVAKTRVVVAEEPVEVVNQAQDPTDQKIEVYPNPAQDQVTVQTAVRLERWQLIHADGRGFPVVAQRTGEKRWRLTWPPELPAGMYSLVGQSTDTLVQHPLVILPSH